VRILRGLVSGTMVVLSLFGVSLAARGAGRDDDDARSTDRRHRGDPPTWIDNRAIDLLAAPAFLEYGTDHAVWESAVFDASQFDTVVLKAKTEIVAGNLYCAVAWSYGAGDGFEDKSISVPRTGNAQLVIELPSVTGAPVLGRLGKVMCYSVPGLVRDGVPAPASGTVHQVRVLLRRQ
jgi:hypothetical protein